MTDWTDETLRPLDELARIAFPESSGVTADTLKRRARKGQLRVYKPGKAFLSTLADVRAMLDATRAKPQQNNVSSTVAPPDQYAAMFGLTEAQAALDRARYKLKSERANEHARKAARAKTRPPRNKP